MCNQNNFKLRIRGNFRTGESKLEFWETDESVEAADLYFICAEVHSSQPPVHKKVELAQKLRQAIGIDPDYLSSYLLLAEINKSLGNIPEWRALIFEAASRAISILEDEDGNLPAEIDFSHLPNRPLMRAINQYVLICWGENDLEQAVEISNYLLRVCPNDNLGCRYTLLAILEGMDAEEFLSDFQDLARADSNWFDKGSEIYPEYFDWWKSWRAKLENN